MSENLPGNWKVEAKSESTDGHRDLGVTEYKVRLRNENGLKLRQLQVVC